MKQKIIDAVSRKLVENFKIEFPPLTSKSVFERKFEIYSTSLKGKIQQLRSTYDACFGNESLLKDRGIISCSKKEFVAQELVNYGYRTISADEKGNIYDKLISEGITEVKFCALMMEYKVGRRFFTSFFDYCKANKNYFKSENDSFNQIIESLCNRNTNESESGSFIDYLLQNIRYRFDNYQAELSGLIDLAEKYTPDNLPFNTVFGVNVGRSNKGWHSILNNGKTFTFQKREGVGNLDLFVAIYILKSDMITRIYLGNGTCLLFTEFLISRDIQRVDIEKGHIVKFYMHKHFDAEEIVFDCDEDAFSFQRALTEKRKRNMLHQGFSRQPSFRR